MTNYWKKYVFAHLPVTRTINWPSICQAAKKKRKIHLLGILSVSYIHKKKKVPSEVIGTLDQFISSASSVYELSLNISPGNLSRSLAASSGCGAECDSVAVESLEPLWCVGWPQTVQVCTPLEAFELSRVSGSAAPGFVTLRKTFFFFPFWKLTKLQKQGRRLNKRRRVLGAGREQRARADVPIRTPEWRWNEESRQEEVEGGAVGREWGRARGPLWTYQTAQECSGKNELGSLAQDGPCDWV